MAGTQRSATLSDIRVSPLRFLYSSNAIDVHLTIDLHASSASFSRIATVCIARNDRLTQGCQVCLLPPLLIAMGFICHPVEQRGTHAVGRELAVCTLFCFRVTSLFLEDKGWRWRLYCMFFFFLLVIFINKILYKYTRHITICQKIVVHNNKMKIKKSSMCELINK